MSQPPELPPLSGSPLTTPPVSSSLQNPLFQNAWSTKITSEIAKSVIGQNEVIERLLVALLANGHVLIEGLPGLAKTLVVKSLASSLGVHFERIQFTPDLLPSDVVGTMVFQPQSGDFSVHQGPVFTNLLLADEINRAPAKVQSALLEAMQERQVTIGGATLALPQPFLVMATQNPLEQEGTYPLPEAQTDRFLFKLLVDYPSEIEELEMMERWGSVTKHPVLQSVSSSDEILSIREQVDQVHVSPTIKAYILSIVRTTRSLTQISKEMRWPELEFGASPRACLSLIQASRALAWLRGMPHVTSDLVQSLVPDTLRHRIGLTYEAEAAGMTADTILRKAVASIPLPVNP